MESNSNNLLISKWKDENNEIFDMKFNKIEFDIDSLKNDEKELFLDRKDFYHFHTMLVYVPMKLLLKLNIEKYVKDICEEMEIHLNSKKNWSNIELFQNFTHILIRYKW